MKKLGVALIIVLLLITFINLSPAQDTKSKDSQNTNQNEPPKNKTPQTITRVNNALEKEIQIPAYIQIPIRILFGIERSISISLLIVILVIWFFSWLLFANVLKLTPFFRNWTAWPAALGVTALIALSGAMKNIALFLLNAGDSFEWLAKISAGALLLIVVVVIAAAVILLKILKKLSEKLELEQARDEGRNIGVSLGFIKSMKEWFSFTRKVNH